MKKKCCSVGIESGLTIWPSVRYPSKEHVCSFNSYSTESISVGREIEKKGGSVTSDTYTDIDNSILWCVKRQKQISHDWYTHILHTASRGNGYHVKLFRVNFSFK